MKNLTIIFALAFITALLFFCYINWLSSDARNGKRNQDNSYRVHAGMNRHEAMNIMGSAKQVRVNNNKTLYQYSAHPFASDDVYIVIGSDSLVERINHGE